MFPSSKMDVFLIFIVFAHLASGAPVQDTAIGPVRNPRDHGCYHNGEHFKNGAQIITHEPCLNCTCVDSVLMCYLRVCPYVKPLGEECILEKNPGDCCPKIWCPEVIKDKDCDDADHEEKHGHPGCYLNGKYYQDGAMLPTDPKKPCEVCYCIQNSTSCVVQQCELKVEGCNPVYRPGQCCPCRYNCTYNEATTVPPGVTLQDLADGCRLPDGRFVEDGESINSTDPCEHCYCMRNEIVCGIQECQHLSNDCKPLPPKPGQCCPDSYICPTTTSIDSSDGPDSTFVTLTENKHIDGMTQVTPQKDVNVKPSSQKDTVIEDALSFKPASVQDSTTTKPSSSILHGNEKDFSGEEFDTADKKLQVNSQTENENRKAVTVNEEHSTPYVTISTTIMFTESDEEFIDTEEHLDTLPSSSNQGIKGETQRQPDSNKILIKEETSAEERPQITENDQHKFSGPGRFAVKDALHSSSGLQATSSHISNHSIIKGTLPIQASSSLKSNTTKKDKINFNLPSVDDRVTENKQNFKPPANIGFVEILPPPRTQGHNITGATVKRPAIKHVGVQGTPSGGYNFSVKSHYTYPHRQRPHLPVGVIPGEQRPSVVGKRPAVVSIPGEGVCRVGKKVFQNGQAVGSTNLCKTNCQCINSVIYCDHVICNVPANYSRENCVSIRISNQCCPRYRCRHIFKTSTESSKDPTKITTSQPSKQTVAFEDDKSTPSASNLGFTLAEKSESTTHFDEEGTIDSLSPVPDKATSVKISGIKSKLPATALTGSVSSSSLPTRPSIASFSTESEVSSSIDNVFTTKAVSVIENVSDETFLKEKESNLTKIQSSFIPVSVIFGENESHTTSSTESTTGLVSHTTEDSKSSDKETTHYVYTTKSGIEDSYDKDSSHSENEKAPTTFKGPIASEQTDLTTISSRNPETSSVAGIISSSISNEKDTHFDLTQTIPKSTLSTFTESDEFFVTDNKLITDKRTTTSPPEFMVSREISASHVTLSSETSDSNTSEEPESPTGPSTSSEITFSREPNISDIEETNSSIKYESVTHQTPYDKISTVSHELTSFGEKASETFVTLPTEISPDINEQTEKSIETKMPSTFEPLSQTNTEDEHKQISTSTLSSHYLIDTSSVDTDASTLTEKPLATSEEEITLSEKSKTFSELKPTTGYSNVVSNEDNVFSTTTLAAEEGIDLHKDITEQFTGTSAFTETSEIATQESSSEELEITSKASTSPEIFSSTAKDTFDDIPTISKVYNDQTPTDQPAESFDGLKNYSQTTTVQEDTDVVTSSDMTISETSETEKNSVSEDLSTMLSAKTTFPEEKVSTTSTVSSSPEKSTHPQESLINEVLQTSFEGEESHITEPMRDILLTDASVIPDKTTVYDQETSFFVKTKPSDIEKQNTEDLATAENYESSYSTSSVLTSNETENQQASSAVTKIIKTTEITTKDETKLSEFDEMTTNFVKTDTSEDISTPSSTPTVVLESTTLHLMQLTDTVTTESDDVPKTLLPEILTHFQGEETTLKETSFSEAITDIAEIIDLSAVVTDSSAVISETTKHFPVKQTTPEEISTYPESVTDVPASVSTEEDISVSILLKTHSTKSTEENLSTLSEVPQESTKSTLPETNKSFGTESSKESTIYSEKTSTSTLYSSTTEAKTTDETTTLTITPESSTTFEEAQTSTSSEIASIHVTSDEKYQINLDATLVPNTEKVIKFSDTLSPDFEITTIDYDVTSSQLSSKTLDPSADAGDFTTISKEKVQSIGTSTIIEKYGKPSTSDLHETYTTAKSTGSDLQEGTETEKVGIFSSDDSVKLKTEEQSSVISLSTTTGNFPSSSETSISNETAGTEHTGKHFEETTFVSILLSKSPEQQTTEDSESKTFELSTISSSRPTSISDLSKETVSPFSSETKYAFSISAEDTSTKTAVKTVESATTLSSLGTINLEDTKEVEEKTKVPLTTDALPAFETNKISSEIPSTGGTFTEVVTSSYEASFIHQSKETLSPILFRKNYTSPSDEEDSSIKTIVKASESTISHSTLIASELEGTEAVETSKVTSTTDGKLVTEKSRTSPEISHTEKVTFLDSTSSDDSASSTMIPEIPKTSFKKPVDALEETTEISKTTTLSGHTSEDSEKSITNFSDDIKSSTDILTTVAYDESIKFTATDTESHKTTDVDEIETVHENIEVPENIDEAIQFHSTKNEFTDKDSEISVTNKVIRTTVTEEVTSSSDHQDLETYSPSYSPETEVENASVESQNSFEKLFTTKLYDSNEILHSTTSSVPSDSSLVSEKNTIKTTVEEKKQETDPFITTILSTSEKDYTIHPIDTSISSDSEQIFHINTNDSFQLGKDPDKETTLSTGSKSSDYPPEKETSKGSVKFETSFPSTVITTTGEEKESLGSSTSEGIYTSSTKEIFDTKISIQSFDNTVEYHYTTDITPESTTTKEHTEISHTDYSTSIGEANENLSTSLSTLEQENTESKDISTQSDVITTEYGNSGETFEDPNKKHESTTNIPSTENIASITTQQHFTDPKPYESTTDSSSDLQLDLKATSISKESSSDYYSEEEHGITETPSKKETSRHPILVSGEFSDPSETKRDGTNQSKDETLIGHKIGEKKPDIVVIRPDFHDHNVETSTDFHESSDTRVSYQSSEDISDTTSQIQSTTPSVSSFEDFSSSDFSTHSDTFIERETLPPVAMQSPENLIRHTEPSKTTLILSPVPATFSRETTLMNEGSTSISTVTGDTYTKSPGSTTISSFSTQDFEDATDRISTVYTFEPKPETSQPVDSISQTVSTKLQDEITQTSLTTEYDNNYSSNPIPENTFDQKNFNESGDIRDQFNNTFTDVSFEVSKSTVKDIYTSELTTKHNEISTFDAEIESIKTEGIPDETEGSSNDYLSSTFSSTEIFDSIGSEISTKKSSEDALSSTISDSLVTEEHTFTDLTALYDKNDTLNPSTASDISSNVFENSTTLPHISNNIIEETSKQENETINYSPLSTHDISVPHSHLSKHPDSSVTAEDSVKFDNTNMDAFKTVSYPLTSELYDLQNSTESELVITTQQNIDELDKYTKPTSHEFPYEHSTLKSPSHNLDEDHETLQTSNEGDSISSTYLSVSSPTINGETYFTVPNKTEDYDSEALGTTNAGKDVTETQFTTLTSPLVSITDETSTFLEVDTDSKLSTEIVKTEMKTLSSVEETNYETSPFTTIHENESTGTYYSTVFPLQNELQDSLEQLSNDSLEIISYNSSFSDQFTLNYDDFETTQISDEDVEFSSEVSESSEESKDLLTELNSSDVVATITHGLLNDTSIVYKKQETKIPERHTSSEENTSQRLKTTTSVISTQEDKFLDPEQSTSLKENYGHLTTRYETSNTHEVQTEKYVSSENEIFTTLPDIISTMPSNVHDSTAKVVENQFLTHKTHDYLEFSSTVTPKVSLETRPATETIISTDLTSSTKLPVSDHTFVPQKLPTTLDGEITTTFSEPKYSEITFTTEEASSELSVFSTESKATNFPSTEKVKQYTESSVSETAWNNAITESNKQQSEITTETFSMIPTTVEEQKQSKDDISTVSTVSFENITTTINVPTEVLDASPAELIHKINDSGLFLLESEVPVLDHTDLITHLGFEDTEFSTSSISTKLSEVDKLKENLIHSVSLQNKSSPEFTPAHTVQPTSDVETILSTLSSTISETEVSATVNIQETVSSTDMKETTLSTTINDETASEEITDMNFNTSPSELITETTVQQSLKPQFAPEDLISTIDSINEVSTASQINNYDITHETPSAEMLSTQTLAEISSMKLESDMLTTDELSTATPSKEPLDVTSTTTKVEEDTTLALTTEPAILVTSLKQTTQIPEISVKTSESSDSSDQEKSILTTEEEKYTDKYTTSSHLDFVKADEHTTHLYDSFQTFSPGSLEISSATILSLKPLEETSFTVEEKTKSTALYDDTSVTTNEEVSTAASTSRVSLTNETTITTRTSPYESNLSEESENVEINTYESSTDLPKKIVDDYSTVSVISEAHLSQESGASKVVDPSSIVASTDLTSKDVEESLEDTSATKTSLFTESVSLKQQDITKTETLPTDLKEKAITDTTFSSTVQSTFASSDTTGVIERFESTQSVPSETEVNNETEVTTKEPLSPIHVTSILEEHYTSLDNIISEENLDIKPITTTLDAEYTSLKTTIVSNTTILSQSESTSQPTEDTMKHKTAGLAENVDTSSIHSTPGTNFIHSINSDVTTSSVQGVSETEVVFDEIEKTTNDLTSESLSAGKLHTLVDENSEITKTSSENLPEETSHSTESEPEIILTTKAIEDLNVHGSFVTSTVAYEETSPHLVPESETDFNESGLNKVTHFETISTEDIQTQKTTGVFLDVSSSSGNSDLEFETKTYRPSDVTFKYVTTTKTYLTSLKQEELASTTEIIYPNNSSLVTTESPENLEIDKNTSATTENDISSDIHPLDNGGVINKDHGNSDIFDVPEGFHSIVTQLNTKHDIDETVKRVPANVYDISRPNDLLPILTLPDKTSENDPNIESEEALFRPNNEVSSVTYETSTFESSESSTQADIHEQSTKSSVLVSDNSSHTFVEPEKTATTVLEEIVKFFFPSTASDISDESITLKYLGSDEIEYNASSISDEVDNTTSYGSTESYQHITTTQDMQTSIGYIAEQEDLNTVLSQNDSATTIDNENIHHNLENTFIVSPEDIIYNFTVKKENDLKNKNLSTTATLSVFNDSLTTLLSTTTEQLLDIAATTLEDRILGGIQNATENTSQEITTSFPYKDIFLEHSDGASSVDKTGVKVPDETKHHKPDDNLPIISTKSAINKSKHPQQSSLSPPWVAYPLHEDTTKVLSTKFPSSPTDVVNEAHHSYTSGPSDFIQQSQESDDICYFEGRVYLSSERVPRSDNCEFCFCFKGDIICLQQQCPPPIKGCYAIPIKGFCCPRFHCPVRQMWFNASMTTTTTTVPFGNYHRKTISTPGCQIAGRTYKLHQVVQPSSNPCMQCRCEYGGIMKCEPRLCKPEAPVIEEIAQTYSKK